MARPIRGPNGPAGIASYQLGNREEFTLLAVTFSLVPLAGAGGDNFAWIDWRDPAGGIIHLQPLSPGDGVNMFYSLTADAEPFVAEPANEPFYPQTTDASSAYYVSQRIPRLTLYSGCTVNVYKTTGSEGPPTDPITAVSDKYAIPDLHLWVEDVGRRVVLPPDPAPLLTYVA